MGTVPCERLAATHGLNAWGKQYAKDDAVLFNEQYVVKHANSKTAFAWHRDCDGIKESGLDPTVPYCSVWIALDNMSSRNGTLCMVPTGGHERTSASFASSLEIMHLNAGDGVVFDSRSVVESPCACAYTQLLSQLATVWWTSAKLIQNLSPKGRSTEVE